MASASLNIFFPDENALNQFAAHFAHYMPRGVVFLQGDLGTGKTTFVRALLRELGVSDKIKSPTYTLVETYDIPPLQIHHFDLYRLRDPQEVLMLGMAEYAEKDALCLIEWPEKGLPHLPQPDLILQLQYAKDGRQLCLNAETPWGHFILEQLS